MTGTLGWIFYAVLCLVGWPAMLLVMYRVAITVLGAHVRGRHSITRPADGFRRRRVAP